MAFWRPSSEVQADPVTRISRSPTVSRPRRSEPESAADAAIVLDRLQELGFVLLAHARQDSNFAFARQLLDAFNIATLVRTPDECDGFRAEPLNLQQLQHRRVVFLEQLGPN